MKKNNKLFQIIMILLGPAGAYIGFYPSISCTPSQAGFWVVLTLGISLGIVLTMLVNKGMTKQDKEASVGDKS